MTAEKDEQAIVAALRAANGIAQSGAEIEAVANLGSGRLYPALHRLEQRGDLLSSWADGEYPRKRLYRLRG